YERR
ncbi:anthranilate synthase component II, partial [Escherichia coli 8.2524]